MRTFFLIFFVCLASAQGSDDLYGAIKEGELILNLRFRLETVDQEGLPKDAFAPTLRTRLGYRTAGFYDWKLMLEFENVFHVGDTNFNDTVNGETRYPVVADPEDTEVNRVALSYTGFDGQAIILGRQRIIFDNSRFIGNVGWRQNEQTFDAALWRYEKTKNIKVTLAYLANVNRIFGNSHPVSSDIRMDTLLANAKFKVGQAGDLVVFGYFIDYQDAPTSSNKTLGFRFDGKHELEGEWFWTHDLSYADQSDYQDGSSLIDAAYYSASLGFGFGPFSFSATQEVLEGDGNYAFVTPLATVHAFNGWADRFITTPTNGILDRFVTFNYKKNLWNVIVRAHQFEADTGNADYGNEIDALVTRKLSKRTSLGLKAADFNSDGFGPDITKLWAFCQYVW